MNKSLFISVISVCALTASMSALADPSWGNDRGSNSNAQPRSNNVYASSQGSRPAQNQAWNTHSGWQQQGNQAQNWRGQTANNQTWSNRTGNNQGWNNQNWNSQNWNNQNTRNQNQYNYRYGSDRDRYTYVNRGSDAYRDRVIYRTGDRLPTMYRTTRYYVNDWQNYHLNEPPRGYRWANVDGNYILVALATGIISQILFGGNYY
ncbi:RcnB family protein [Acinetobacter gerneri]|uniref:RcnB family protein n=1 Tax=Acinetobacter gerneri TaxID=202952 RepID=UPI003213C2F1